MHWPESPVWLRIASRASESESSEIAAPVAALLPWLVWKSALPSLMVGHCRCAFEKIHEHLGLSFGRGLA